MKRALTAAALLTALAASAFGAPATDAKFAQHKDAVLSLISQRQAILAQEKTCVEAASNAQSLKACHEAAKGERQTMADKAKALKPAAR